MKPRFGSLALAALAFVGMSQQAEAKAREHSVCYTVEISTKGTRGAGTDSNITLTAYGSVKGKKATVTLNPLIRGNAFKRGKTSVAKWCMTRRLGYVRKVKLKSDGRYAASNWNVGTVKIIPPTGREDRATTFKFNTWLDDASKTVSCSKCPKSSWGADWDYLRVRVHTGTVARAGTDANVWLTVKGSKGTTRKIRLTSYMRGNAFESGDTDTARVWLDEDIGRPEAITFWLEGAYAANDWFVDSVEILDKSGRTSEFTIQAWMTRDTIAEAGTFAADHLTRKITKDGEVTRETEHLFEVQAQHNLGSATQRDFQFEFTSGVERAVSLMDSTGKTDTKSVSVTVGTGDDATYKAELTAGLEFSNTVQTEVNRALNYLAQTTTTQPFPLPPNSITFVECTWVYPRNIMRVTDGQEDYYLRTFAERPSLNCGPQHFQRGDVMTIDQQNTARRNFANWDRDLRDRAINAGIVLR